MVKPKRRTIAAGRNSIVEGKYNIVDVDNSVSSRSYKGDFQLNSTYKISDVVFYNNKLYLAIESSFTAATTPDLDTINWRNWSNRDSDIFSKYAYIIGNGGSESSRDNAYTLDWLGNGWFAGKVSDKDGQLATELYVQQYAMNMASNKDFIETLLKNIPNVEGASF